MIIKNCIFENMKKLIIIAVIFTSCFTPKQRYDRLVTKYPDLIETDTVTIKDTLIEIDTIMTKEFSDSFIIEHDTFFETKKLIIKKKGKHFGITVKPDTITFRDTIPYEVKVPGKIVKIKETNYMLTIIFSIFCLILGLFIGLCAGKLIFKD
jgi:hypothetical protein